MARRRGGRSMGRAFSPIYHCDEPGHIGDVRWARRTIPASPRSKGGRDRRVARSAEYLLGRAAATRAHLRCHQAVRRRATAFWSIRSYPPQGKRALLAHAR